MRQLSVIYSYRYKKLSSIIIIIIISWLFFHFKVISSSMTHFLLKPLFHQMVALDDDETDRS